MSAGDDLLTQAAQDADPGADFLDLLRAGGTCAVVRPDLTVLAASDAYLNAACVPREKLVGRLACEVLGGRANSEDWRASVERVVRTRTPDAMPLERRLLGQAGARADERSWSRVN